MISILMSVHNPVEKYFKLCIDSIFNQTYQDFELVIIDDGSDTPVIEILKNFKCDLKKIKYIRLDNNVGLPKALNIGIKECSGDFIARMDDDDIMEPNRLEQQLNYVRNNNYDGCWSWAEIIDDKNNSIGYKKIVIEEKKYLDQLLNRGNIFIHPTLFIKKTCLENINGYDENLRYAQDSELYIRLLSKYKIGMVKETLLKYRRNNYRNNSYRETLSLNYALFGAMNYYTDKGQLKFGEKIKIFLRLLRYYKEILSIAKRNR